MATYEGIDISHWETFTDWKAVRASPLSQFVVAKCTEGTTYLDPSWPLTYTACISQGIPISAYHFYRYGLSPAAQADWFAKKTGDKIFQVWADVETAVLTQLKEAKITDADATLQSLEGDVKLFMERLVSEYGYEVGIYSSPAFLKAYFPNAAWLEKYPLWIAHLGVTTPTIPYPWNQYGAWGVNKKVPLWQYRWDLVVPGIDGACDANHFSPACGDIYTYFGNGEPYQEDTEVPDYLFSKYTNLRIRTGPSIAFSVVGYTTDIKLAFEIIAEKKDDAGNLWYQIGRYRWVMGSYCEVIS